jgi:LCP family protein required for cell wall assembly
VLKTSAFGSALALAVLLISFAFKGKIAPLFLYALWIAVFIRFLVPGFLPISIIVGAESAKDSETPSNETWLSLIESIGADATSPVSDGVWNAPSEDAASELHPAVKTPPRDMLWIFWIIPMLAIFIFKIASFQFFKVRILKLNSRASKQEETLLESLAKSYGIRRRIRLYRNSGISSAFAIGLFRPIIALSDRDLSESQLIFMLKHELVHVKRLDALTATFIEIVKSVHWFNPLIYSAGKSASFFREASCDEIVLRGACLIERKGYSLTMIDGIEKKAVTPLCISLTNSGASLKKRISLILDGGRKNNAKLAALLTLAVLAASACSGVKVENREASPIEIPAATYQADAEVNSSDALDDSNDVKAQSIVKALIASSGESGGFNVGTDVIMALVADNSKGEITLTFLPRDTGVASSDNGPIDKKLSQIGSLDDDAMTSLQTEAGKILGLEFDYYVRIDMASFEALVDAIGGIEMEIPAGGLYYRDPFQNLQIELEPGLQLLNGKKALELARYRATYSNGDLDRINVQEQLIKSAYGKLLASKDVETAKTLLKILIDGTSTNMSLDDIPAFMEMFKSLRQDSLRFTKLPGEAMYLNERNYYVVDQSALKAD